MKNPKQKLSEYDEQCLIFEWARANEGAHPELWLLNASMNGIRTSIGLATKMKRQGLKRGYPDIFLPVPKKYFHGLFIELKIKGNKTSEYQEEWLKRLTDNCYDCRVCYGHQEAIKVIKEYLGI